MKQIDHWGGVTRQRIAEDQAIGRTHYPPVDPSPPAEPFTATRRSSSSSSTSKVSNKKRGSEAAVAIVMFLLFFAFVAIAQTNFGILSTPGILAFAAGGMVLSLLLWKIRKVLLWSSAVLFGLYLMYYFIHNRF